MELYLYSPCLHGVASDNFAFFGDIATCKVRLLKKMAASNCAEEF
jgi:hypothetical protein